MCTEEGSLLPFPSWAAWLADLGAWAAGLGAADNKVIIAISVPDLGYAAAVTGCGVVYGAFRPQLNALPSGTQFGSAGRLGRHEHAVRLVPVAGNASFLGIFHGLSNDLGRELFHVGGVKLPADRYRIDVLSWPDRPSELSAFSSGLQPLQVADGVAGLLPGPTADFCGFSALHCVIVGSAVQIQEEAEALIAADAVSPAVPLGALLRIRLVGDVGRQYRSLLLPSLEDPNRYRELVTARRPAVVILNGAAVVCRWLGARMAPVTLALIERPGTSSENAASALDRDRARSKHDVQLPPDLAHVPDGIEVLTWQDTGPRS